MESRYENTVNENYELSLRAEKEIAYYKDQGYSEKEIQDFLRDGEALLSEGHTDDDQETIEEMLSILIRNQ